MLRVLIFSALLAVALCHDSSSESHEHLAEKRGHCPPVSSNSSVSACSTPCTNGTNCTIANCSSDTNCTGAQKCCNTNCGLMCVDPVYKTICEEDNDCEGTLVCCKKSCVPECAPLKPVKPPKKHGKEWKRR
ncbi:waprin-Phi1-like [Pseudophryne corroboree]|uniref:waprin-Phi1-like n=1 Tax=Pseudophryne corroboree TaxID=495146 RepID=UPI003081DC2C